MSTLKDGISSSAVIERLKSELNVKSDVAIASILGVARTNISTWRKRGTIPYEELFWTCKNKGIDLDWIITGETSFANQMMKAFVPAGGEVATHDSATYMLGTPDNFDDDYVGIRQFKVDISAGHGSEAPAKEEYNMLYFRREMFIKDFQLNPDHIIAGRMVGDSMEPEIESNSIIFINHTIKTLTSGLIYVFNVGGDLLGKRMIRDLDGSWVAHSENREKYPPRKITSDELESLNLVGLVELTLPIKFLN